MSRNPRYIWRGDVNRTAVQRCYARSHAMVISSLMEGGANVVSEAIVAGLPVIASIHDAGAEVNVDGETGYNVDLDRADHLTECLIAVLRDTDLAQNLGRNGLARWTKHFRYSCFADRFLEIWRRFLESEASSVSG